jgi:hypothetical protein
MDKKDILKSLTCQSRTRQKINEVKKEVDGTNNRFEKFGER